MKTIYALKARIKWPMRFGSLLLYLFFLTTLAGAQDFQLWNEVDLTASWRKLDFLMPLLSRTDTSLPNPQLAATGVLAGMPLPWHLILTGGYLFADLPQRSTLVHLPLVAVSGEFHTGRLTVMDRNRFEKLVGFGTSPVRYRNRLLIDRPFTQNRWHVFASDEIIFNLSDSTWSQNRFQAGTGARLNERLFLDIYYLQRNAGGNAPITYALGTTLTVALNHKKQRL